MKVNDIWIGHDNKNCAVFDFKLFFETKYEG
jgi:hypothetical protein